MEMKRFQSTRPLEELEQLFNKVIDFCKIKDPKSKEIQEYFNFIRYFKGTDFTRYFKLVLTLENKDSKLSEKDREEVLEPVPRGNKSYADLTNLPPKEEDDKLFVKRKVCEYLENKIYPHSKGRKSLFKLRRL